MAARDASSDEERASGERALGERAHVRLRASVIKRTSWPEVRKVRRLTPNPSSRSPAKSCRILAASPVAAATIASPQVESAAICRSCASMSVTKVGKHCGPTAGTSTSARGGKSIREIESTREHDSETCD